MARKKFKEWDEYNTTMMEIFVSWLPTIIILLSLLFIFSEVFAALNGALEDVVEVTKK